MAYDQHQRESEPITPRCAVVTLSDTRTESTDTSGRRIRELLAADGHTLARSVILPDDPGKLPPLLDELLASPDVDVILTNGGTGISRRDQTIVVIERKL